MGLAVSQSLSSLAQNEVGLMRTQTLELQPGWNAIYLEVDPAISSPDELFGELPIDMVATYATSTKSAQFIGDPSAEMLNAYGWAVWYAPSRPDGFLSSLYMIYGAKPYLVHALTNLTLSIAGTDVWQTMQWKPDAFNFVGFSVAEQGPPTFGQFFAASPAHNHNKLYRLVQGTWRQVLSPAAESMRSGEAFWIFCDGRSDYTGPLAVTASSGRGVALSSSRGSQLTFRNRTDHPVEFRMEHQVDPDHPIPLSTPVRATDDATGDMRVLTLNYGTGNFEQAFPPLEAGEAIRLPLELRLQDTGAGLLTSLIKIITDMGTVTYLPVTATRDDL